MIEIVSGTDRPQSNSIKVAKILLELYRSAGVDVGLIDLSELNHEDLHGGDYFKGARGTVKTAVDRVTKADGVVVVVPEYNGSFPGALKLFIDYWKYPDTFEARPVAMVGIGQRWGGLRPVEHLQQVFGYRNAFIFPQRVFIHNVSKTIVDGAISDQLVSDLMKTQTQDFVKFVKGLNSQGLDANSRLRARS
jgi:NAD(P)H-dependent FMN reductase